MEKILKEYITHKNSSLHNLCPVHKEVSIFRGLTFCFGPNSSFLELDPDREAHIYFYFLLCSS